MAITVSFKGEDWIDILGQMQDFTEGANMIRSSVPSAPALAPAPEPEPVKIKKGRGKALPTPAEMIAATAPEPEPEPAPEPDEPGVKLPTLEALKATITQAVRAAQNKEGPRLILDLLPAFKAKTKLDFIMHAKEEHRSALFDLVNEAKL